MGFLNDDIILSFPLFFPTLKHSHMTFLAIVQIHGLLFINCYEYITNVCVYVIMQSVQFVYCYLYVYFQS